MVWGWWFGFSVKGRLPCASSNKAMTEHRRRRINPRFTLLNSSFEDELLFDLIRQLPSTSSNQFAWTEGPLHEVVDNDAEDGITKTFGHISTALSSIFHKDSIKKLRFKQRVDRVYEEDERPFESLLHSESDAHIYCLSYSNGDATCFIPLGRSANMKEKFQNTVNKRNSISGSE